ncbi:MAG: hypothetical protein H7319_22015 [Spirosoma sp.]|nr:hypothetical protein [Spirosoma sp.]
MGIAAFIVASGLSAVAYYQDRIISEQLAECSIYSVAHINRVYKLRSMAHIEYDYSVGGRVFQSDEPVNSFDTGEIWSVDFEKLSKRRLLLAIYYSKPDVNRILWDIPVPDTLRHISIEGWREVPFEKRKPTD